MRKIMLTSLAPVALTAAFAAPALAGNLEEPVVEEVVTAPAPVVDYGSDWTGFYGGLSLGTGSGSIETDAGDADFDINNSFGAQAGYLWDNGSLVYGGELAYQSLQLDADGAEEDGDVFALKGRIGYDAGQFLPYATAGFANLNVDGESGDGYVLGAGLEYAATENIRVRGEYLNHQFDDFGDTDGVDVKADTFSIGLNYAF
ncbi:outer membrane protein [Vannielia litorea]|uniref:outer membrane protein n=1 Tax=Vannielia litorea TaxID=1217970 RepID=UPI001BD00E8F|nr:outer membrane beta-barrel protein [Vannielia litorea]MBS8225210.1 porin family protein [Vannielia litorea]